MPKTQAQPAGPATLTTSCTQLSCEQLLLQLSKQAQEFGNQHATTLATAHKLVAACVQGCGGPEAERVLRSAVACLDQLLGADHVQTMVATSCLVTYLFKADSSSSAEVFGLAGKVQQWWDKRESLKGAGGGKDHYHTAITTCLGTYLVRIGGFKEAVSMGRCAYAACLEADGHDAPTTTSAAVALHQVMCEAGLWSQGMRLMQSVLGRYAPGSAKRVTVITMFLDSLSQLDSYPTSQQAKALCRYVALRAYAGACLFCVSEER